MRRVIHSRGGSSELLHPGPSGAMMLELSSGVVLSNRLPPNGEYPVLTWCMMALDLARRIITSAIR